MTTRRTRPLCAVLVLLPAFLLLAAAAAGAADPPPIPTPQEREAFVRSEQQALAGYPPSDGERAVHDEYDVTHYDITLGLNIPAHIITGSVEVRAKSAAAGLNQIHLDLYSPMVVDGVTVNGNPAVYSHVGGVITVTLDGIYQPEDSFTVVCAWHGSPSYSGNPFRWNTHAGSVPMVLSYSEPFGSPAWWVCKDDPKDKALYSCHVTAPDTLFTVSNGLLQSVVDNGNGTATCNWATNYPMSNYLFSIAVTNYQHWSAVYTALDQVRTMTVDYYAYPEDLIKTQTSWAHNIQMMEYYAGIFGEYPFLEEKYALAEFQYPGAMEHQTATSMGWGYINGTNSNDFVVAHELSHSWVGDMITMRDYGHAWTKEGFATLCEALYFESLYGLDYYHSYMNGMNVLSWATKQLYNCNPPLDGTIYYKGGWVLHMLRHMIGDPAFFAGMRGYTNNPALMYGTNTTDDLRAAFEASSGTDLGWFFDQWVYHPGYPQIVQSWQSSPAGGGYDVNLALYQVQTIGPIFKLPLDVVVHTSLGDERFAIRDSLFNQSFTLHVAGAPQGVELDPDHWMILKIMTGTDVAAPPPSIPRLLSWAEESPMTPGAGIRFTLPGSGTARLRLFDTSGRLLRTLFQGTAGPGEHRVTWDGRDAQGSPAASGVYYQRLEQDHGAFSGTVVLIR